MLQPQCEPCPPHAYCYPNLRTVCEPGFVLQQHPFSLGGLVPLPPTCEPDGEKAKRVKAVVDRAVEELRRRNGVFECGELTEVNGKPVPSPDISEETLKSMLSSKKRKGMTDEEFEALWVPVIGEILSRDEITSGADGDSRTLRSNSLAARQYRQTLVQYRLLVAVLMTILSLIGYAKYSIEWNRRTEEQAKQLASYALDRLATQAALHANQPDIYREPYIAMGHLRDDVLREEFSATRRGKLWEKVQKKVEGNSDIRPAVREGRHGDVSRVWEWVGAVRAIEDGRGSDKRDSSWYTLGPIIGSSPATEDVSEIRYWEESRLNY